MHRLMLLSTAYRHHRLAVCMHQVVSYVTKATVVHNTTKHAYVVQCFAVAKTTDTSCPEHAFCCVVHPGGLGYCHVPSGSHQPRVRHAGLLQMSCDLPASQSFWAWLAPVTAVVIALLPLSWLMLADRSPLASDWNALHVNMLKHRCAFAPAAA